MNRDVAYDCCEVITRREARNFSYGIRLLAKPKRQALSAVYALARRIDDIGDGDDTPQRKLAGLASLREQLNPIDPYSNDPVLIAVADAAARFELPMGCIDDIIVGCEMDVNGTSYETLDSLVVYCRKVAGSVGQLTIAILGAQRIEGANSLADSLGVALQLTNILRDVLEDRSLGRVYLPREDALQVNCAPDLTGPASDLGRLIALECKNARTWFNEGLQLLELLHGRDRACVAAMAGIYERLLRRIERDPLAVTRGRISVPSWEKLDVAVRSLVASSL